MVTHMIEVQRLVFEYPGVRALDDISFAVKRAGITALVGPNGAGKTTLLRCLAALEQPLSGDISIDGLDVLENPRAVHRRVGYLADFLGLYRDLTVQQCLSYVARAHYIPKADQSQAVLKAAERLHIDDRLGSKVASLSRGLAQRLAIAQAIVHEPSVLLLDEPASGLDPEARDALAQLFLELRVQGMTLVVSSHILAELEAYSDNMIILRGGRILEHVSLQSSAEQAARIQLMLSFPMADLCERLIKLGVTECTADGTTANFRFAADMAARHALLKALIDQGVPVSSFGEVRVNLQQHYLTRVAQLDRSS
jgi:ABC-2 type transport system ATP-binding protein